MPSGLDHVENVGPDTDVRYVHGRAPRRPDMCPQCFSTDTAPMDEDERFRCCNTCGEIFT